MSIRDLWALVPLKRMDRGKERLGDALDAPRRRALIEAMAEDVLDALRGLGLEPAQILLVSEDSEVAGLARRAGVGLYRPRSTAIDPLNAALLEAGGFATEQGARHLLIMHADLPLAHPAELDRLLSAHMAALRQDADRLVTLITDREGQGTNCLVATPPDAIAWRFGADSRFAHRRACESAGARWAEFDSIGLGRDIDHPQDLAALVRICQCPDNSCGARTRALLVGTPASRYSGRTS